MKPSIDKKVQANVKKEVSSSKSFTKTEILSRIAAATDISRKKIDQVMQELESIIAEHIEKGLPFSLPGLLKIYVVSKPSTSERKGTNPFTGEPTVFKAKPAHKIVRVKALKKLKSMA